MERAKTETATINEYEVGITAQGISVMSPKTAQFGTTRNKPKGRNRGYYGNHAFDIGMGYPGSPLSIPVISKLPGGFGDGDD